MLDFVNNYSKKWFGIDMLIVLDILTNILDKTEYEVIANVFGIEPGYVNSVVSVIELARFVVLTKDR